jgi:rod shape determining protein RodA
LMGKGFMQGTQAQLNFLPEKHTDFIFTMFAEEMGFIGAVSLLALYLLVLLFIAYMALRCRSTFARLVAAGIGLCLFTYVFINVAMVTGLVPVVGVPLPLVSYGGTSMVTMMIGLGFVLNAHVSRGVRIRREELGPIW